jgi:propionate CoA-transferase
MSKDRLTGPGGFIDISSCTKDVYFMASFTAVGLEVEGKDGKLNIQQEGKVKKFVPEVYEKTFSGDEAVKRGQFVYFVTERAVFRRTSSHDVLELIEIAPGVDLQKDILDQMDFKPAISPDLTLMDARIFRDEKMNAANDFFGSLEGKTGPMSAETPIFNHDSDCFSFYRTFHSTDRCSYHEDDHTMYLELFGITLNTEDDVEWFFGGLRELLKPCVDAKGKINMVINYEGFDLSNSLEELYGQKVEELQQDMYSSAKRYTGRAFQRARLKNSLSMDEWNPDEMFDRFDTRRNGVLSIEELREGFLNNFKMSLTPSHIKEFVGGLKDPVVDRDAFVRGVKAVLQEVE